MSWLSEAVAAAKSKLSHPGAPTEGQLTELVHMLEALGVTVEGKLKAAAPAIVSAADAPTKAVEAMITNAIAAAKNEISGSLAEVFKEFAAKQIAAVADLQQRVDGLGQLQSLVNVLSHPPSVPIPAPAAPPASATVAGAAPMLAMPTPPLPVT